MLTFLTDYVIIDQFEPIGVVESTVRILLVNHPIQGPIKFPEFFGWFDQTLVQQSAKVYLSLRDSCCLAASSEPQKRRILQYTTSCFNNARRGEYMLLLQKRLKDSARFLFSITHTLCTNNTQDYFSTTLLKFAFVLISRSWGKSRKISGNFEKPSMIWRVFCVFSINTYSIRNENGHKKTVKMSMEIVNKNWSFDWN